MNMITYDPFRELRSLQDEVNRIFSGTINRESSFNRSWNPSVDIFERGDSLFIEAELPGLSPEDVEVSIENNVLTIHGERKFEKKDDGDNFHRIERSYGSFTRSFTIPPTVSADGAEASFENGVLRLQLAKREDAKPRRIEIKGVKEPEVLETKVKAHSQG